jgi:hypothetical protein
MMQSGQHCHGNGSISHLVSATIGVNKSIFESSHSRGPIVAAQRAAATGPTTSADTYLGQRTNKCSCQPQLPYFAHSTSVPHWHAREKGEGVWVAPERAQMGRPFASPDRLTRQAQEDQASAIVFGGIRHRLPTGWVPRIDGSPPQRPSPLRGCVRALSRIEPGPLRRTRRDFGTGFATQRRNLYFFVRATLDSCQIRCE